MYKYKIMSLSQFASLPEIIGIEDKRKYSPTENKFGAEEFTQLMFDYMSSLGWDFVGITSVNTKIIDTYADTSNKGTFLSAVGTFATQKAKEQLAKTAGPVFASTVEVFIFKREISKSRIEKENNVSNDKIQNESIKSEFSNENSQSGKDLAPNIVDDEKFKEAEPILLKLKKYGYEFSSFNHSSGKWVIKTNGSEFEQSKDELSALLRNFEK